MKEQMADHSGILRAKELLVKARANSFMSVHPFYFGKTVLITGAGGSIGSALAKQIAAAMPKRLILLDHNENGVYDLLQDLYMECISLHAFLSHLQTLSQFSLFVVCINQHILGSAEYPLQALCNPTIYV